MLSLDNERKKVLVDALWARMVEVQSNAKARLLDRSNVQDFVFWLEYLYYRALALGLPPENIYLRIDGGQVHRNYGWPGETSIIAFQHGEVNILRGPAIINGRGRGVARGGILGKKGMKIQLLN